MLKTKYISNNRLFILTYLFLYKHIRILLKAMHNKRTLVWLVNRLTDKEWYREKLIQLRN